MKTALFFPSGVLAGAEQLLLQVAIQYEKSGAEIHLFFLTDIGTENLRKNTFSGPHMFFHVIKAKRESVGLFKGFAYLVARRKLFCNIDIVYSSHVHINTFVNFLRKLKIVGSEFHVARETNQPFTRYSGSVLFYLNTLYTIGYSKIDLLICQTDLMKADLLKHKPNLGVRKIVVLQNPVSKNNLPLTIHKPDGFGKYIVAAGRLIEEKGFDILIDSFNEVILKYPDLDLIILGEGPKYTELDMQIKSLKLDKKVYLLGWSSNVYMYFKYADICVVSSTMEGFPNVLLQMMMVNNNVVSTLCAGGIDLIKGVKTCAPGNVNALSEAILWSLANDNNNNRELFDIFLRKNSIESYVQKIEEYLHA